MRNSSAAISLTEAPPRAAPAWGRGVLLAVAAAAVAAVALRCYAFFQPSLWTDELFSSAVACSPLPDVLAGTLRFDVHPPLYYLQLHVWCLAGDGDRWLLLNSLVLALAGGWSIHAVMSRLYGARAGSLGLAVWAVMPLQVFFAGQLRMYALTSLIIFWLFYFGERALRAERFTLRAMLPVALLAAALVLSHGFGFLVAAFLALDGIVRLVARGRTDALPAWIAGWMPAGLLALYPLAIGSVRDTVGISHLSPMMMGQELTIVLLGLGMPAAAWLWLVMAPFVVAALAVRESRPAMLLFCVPILFMIAVSVLYKPVYTFRGGGLFTPFLCIALGLLAARLFAPDPARSAAARGAGGLALLAILTAASVREVVTYYKEDMAGLSRTFFAASRPGDALYVEAFISDFWGMIHYAPARVAFGTLDVQPPTSPKWDGIKRWSGTADPLNLFGHASSIVLAGRSVYPWFDADRARRGGAVFWLLSADTASCRGPERAGAIMARTDRLLLIRCRTTPIHRTSEKEDQNDGARDL